MDDIEKRLRESTDSCISGLENWIKQNKNVESRETLMEAVHEVRKVLSRVEIEIALSERERLGSRPLPIPPHRSSRKAPSDMAEGEDSDENYGNTEEGSEGEPVAPARRSGGRNRRPQGRGGSGGGDR